MTLHDLKHVVGRPCSRRIGAEGNEVDVGCGVPHCLFVHEELIALLYWTQATTYRP
jgi:hypothetical protein